MQRHIYSAGQRRNAVELTEARGDVSISFKTAISAFFGDNGGKERFSFKEKEEEGEERKAGAVVRRCHLLSSPESRDARAALLLAGGTCLGNRAWDVT
ncbi:hypothetical protein NDU88_004736 [Pleurodeles waltl]|uniref:Uncharacterized protein n=1 Tax=Pleurodeles waltl TaxID=8319 RepID=A0AAV7M7Z2_PLEWA|nr:hypothetical protein NDU88_004736 [Pleurodeles waltl]